MIRRIRLVSGLVMLAYITMHLLNHALGLVSIAAMGCALSQIVYPIWSQMLMRAALYDIRGKQEKLAVAVFASARDLPEPETETEAESAPA
jgi:adenylate cyclase